MTPDLFPELDLEPVDAPIEETGADQNAAIWQLLGCWFVRDIDKRTWLADERDDPGWDGHSPSYWIEHGQGEAVVTALRKLREGYDADKAATLWPFGERRPLTPPTPSQKALAEQYTPPPHPCIYRWRFAGCLGDLRGFSKQWHYVDPVNAWAGWPMRKTEAEGNAVVEPVTAALLEQLLDEAYEEGRSDEKFGCERGERPVDDDSELLPDEADDPQPEASA